MADSLKAFLAENVVKKEPVGYVASPRFMVDGEPVEWKLRVLTNDEMDKLHKRHTKRVPMKGTRDFKTEFDNEAFAMDMALQSIVYPNLDDAELQDSWGTIGAEDTLKAMLTPGELTDLYSAVAQVCDFEAGMDDKIKRVKNS